MPNPNPLLLVDDEPEELHRMQAALMDLGHPILTADSGEEALRKAAGEDLALAILDVRMPGMDGHETARALRQAERNRNVPVIFLAGVNPQDLPAAGDDERIRVDFLFKPVPPRLLKAKVRAFLEAARDAEALVRLNEQLTRQTDALEASQRDMEAYAYTVSHDMRSPLKSIHAHASQILEEGGGQLATGIQAHLAKIMATATRTSQLVEGLLSLGSARHTALSREPVDLARIVRDIVEGLKEMEPERNLTLSAPETLPADADPTLVRVLLENLVGNAWKFTAPKPRATITLETAVPPEGGTAYVVRDDGIGFDMKHAEQLFLPFLRLHTEGEFEGSGIGLAPVQRIVRRHGGRIWAEGKPGQGAAFLFTLG